MAPTLSFGDYGRDRTTPMRLWNMYWERTPQGPSEIRLLQRPGLHETSELGAGPGRATFVFQGNRITISGVGVYRNNTLIGLVPADGAIRFAFSNDECVVMVDDNPYYVTLSAVLP